MKKKPAKEYISIQGRWNTSFTLSSFFSWALPLLLHRFFNAPAYTATIIPLGPCALNVEIQHFVLSFTIPYWDLIKFPSFADTTKRGVGGERRPKDRGDDRVILQISLMSVLFSKTDNDECVEGPNTLRIFLKCFTTPWNTSTAASSGKQMIPITLFFSKIGSH